MPGEDGALKALEVHIFPELMRGAGEGFRPFDLAPGSTMTNGAVNARVEQVNGPQIVVAYKGGEQTIAVDKSTPIVAIEPGGLGDLMAGAAIVARGGAGEGGAYEARRVVVGVGGVDAADVRAGRFAFRLRSDERPSAPKQCCGALIR